MTASAVTSVPASEVIGLRYARRTSPTDYRGHYLTRTWEEGQGGTRPAVCGVRAKTWKPVDRFPEPSKYPPCPDCTTTAGIDEQPKPLGATTRIAGSSSPTPGRRVDPHALTPVAADVNTHAARVGRRTAFLRDLFPTSE